VLYPYAGAILLLDAKDSPADEPPPAE
jgi:hypothetical protein